VYAWIAHEPQLIFGAKRARILTEINRLPQPATPASIFSGRISGFAGSSADPGRLTFLSADPQLLKN
jgi:hypothetical protein